MPARPERAEKLWARLGELENLLASEVDVPRDWRRRALLRLSEEIAEEARQEEREACCEAIRSKCGPCGGAGYTGGHIEQRGEIVDLTSECEYCGRPIDAIRARRSSPSPRGPEAKGESDGS